MCDLRQQLACMLKLNGIARRAGRSLDGSGAIRIGLTNSHELSKLVVKNQALAKVVEDRLYLR
ncbi:hypothetical protein D3C71_1763160 [compost metagenome]